MTRRKSACLNWTLVLVLFVFCPYVYSRPQDASENVVSSSTNNLISDKPTENPIRYRYRHNISNNSHKSPLEVSFDYKIDLGSSNFTIDSIKSIENLPELIVGRNNRNNSMFISSRFSRVIRQKLKNKTQYKTNNRHKTSTSRPLRDLTNVNDSFKKGSNKRPNIVLGQKDKISITKKRNKPVIKKVVTKWTDSTKFDGLHFTYESTTSDENKLDSLIFPIKHEQYSTESIEAELGDSSENRFPDKRYRPQYSEETQIYSSNFHIPDRYPFVSTRPPYIFNTPTPTPVITNVGYPQPWPQHHQQPIYQNVQTRPTTQKPKKTLKPVKDSYNYHNTFQNNYPQYPNFEVTTFQPTTAYTDRIVIRPEEYSASPDDCPTIFLTLNNTFQGQGKEACPDLNIAVNTNVINKNVVVESEEENDPTLTEVFGLPLADDSESEEVPQDYFDSVENQEETESASVEASSLLNDNAANVAESAEPEGFGSSSGSLSAISRPGRPNDNDDDSFGLSSILSFFKPAINAFAWLATINPLSFGLLSILLSPLVLLVAGTSGLAALFAPFALSYGREAPKIVHVYRPQWQWDDEYKAWQLNSFPDRQWNPTSPRSNEIYTNTMRSSIKATWFYKLKELMKAATEKLKTAENNISLRNNRKYKRKKRETWTIRVK